MSHRARKPARRYGWEIVAVSSPIWFLLLCGILSGIWQFLATLGVIVVISVSAFGTLTLLERARQDARQAEPPAIVNYPPTIPYGYTNGIGQQNGY
jgi:hypothetical protein